MGVDADEAELMVAREQKLGQNYQFFSALHEVGDTPFDYIVISSVTMETEDIQHLLEQMLIRLAKLIAYVRRHHRRSAPRIICTQAPAQSDDEGAGDLFLQPVCVGHCKRRCGSSAESSAATSKELWL